MHYDELVTPENEDVYRERLKETKKDKKQPKEQVKFNPIKGLKPFKE